VRLVALIGKSSAYRVLARKSGRNKTWEDLSIDGRVLQYNIMVRYDMK
jgi:hypothetical protein